MTVENTKMDSRAEFVNTLDLVLKKLPSFVEEAKEGVLLRNEDWDIISQNQGEVITYKGQPLSELLQIAGIILLSENNDLNMVLQLTTHTKHKLQHEIIMDLLEDKEKLNEFLNCVVVLDEEYSRTFTDLVSTVQRELLDVDMDDEGGVV